jgi:hypothetical protein
VSFVIRLSVLGLLMVAGFAVWTQGDLLDRWGLNFAAFAEFQEREGRASQRRQALVRRAEITRKRIDAKEAVIKDLLAERLTFLKAARRFKDLNEQPVTFQDNYRAAFAGRSDGEKVCRQVLVWTEAGLTKLTPSQAEKLRCRFEEELAENMRQNGGMVVLP